MKVREEDLDTLGARVLVVDDEPTNLDMLYKVLADRGYDVLVATSGVIPSRKPIDVAPRTSKSAPSNNKARPTVKKKSRVFTRARPACRQTR